VDDVEEAISKLAHAQVHTETLIQQLTRDVSDFKHEMSEFKKEMSDFKKEMSDFKKEMSDFKKEMSDFKREAEADRKRMNKAWGDLANRLGTIAEDVVAPNIRRLALDEFGFEQIDDFLVRPERRSRRGPNRVTMEYDIICGGPGKVIVVEVKTTFTREVIPAFQNSLRVFLDFFPEYAESRLFGVIASWSLPEALRPAVSKAGFFGLAMGDETMEIVARPVVD
jgi:hypothetical protein